MTKDTRSIQVGGLYAIHDPDGSWRVIKVLAVDDFAVHLRSYANRFPEQPKDIDLAKLTMGIDNAEAAKALIAKLISGDINDAAGFGIEHIPVAKEGFFNENPVLIKVVPVKEEELEGYKLYLDSMRRGQ